MFSAVFSGVQELKHVDPGAMQAQEGMRAALGSDYAQQIRSDAKPFAGAGAQRGRGAGAEQHTRGARPFRAAGRQTRG